MTFPRRNMPPLSIRSGNCRLRRIPRSHGRPEGHAKADARAYHQQLIERITRLPGVRAVGFAELFLPSPEGWHDAVSAATSDWSRASDVMADTALVSPDFFRTMCIPLLRGREFDWTDD